MRIKKEWQWTYRHAERLGADYLITPQASIGTPDFDLMPEMRANPVATRCYRHAITNYKSPYLHSPQTTLLPSLTGVVVLPPTVVVSGACYTNNPGEVHTCVDAASGGIVWQKGGNVTRRARAP